jgi:hypothetical protein
VTLTATPDPPEQGLYRFLILVVELLSAQELHFREEVLQGGNGIADQAEVLKPFVLDGFNVSQNHSFFTVLLF